MNTDPRIPVDPALDREYRPKFERLLPLLLKRSRTVQIGQARKCPESTMRRRLAWYGRLILALWGTTVLLGVLGVFFACSGRAIEALFSFEFVFVAGMLAFAAQNEGFIPSRWIVLRDGLLLRNAKDRRVFLPWRAIRGFSTKYHFKWSRIAVRVNEHDEHDASGERIEWIHAENDALSPFLAVLLDRLPDGIERGPLLRLQRKLRFVALHRCFFSTKESLLVFSTLICAPISVVLTFLFPIEKIGFTAWFAMMGALLAVTFGAYLAVRRRMSRRHAVYLNALLDEWERTDTATAIAAYRDKKPEFGPAPRIVSDKAKRAILFRGDLHFMFLIYCGFFAFMAMAFAGISFVTDKQEIRYGFLPWRWEKAGEGRIVAIADSSTEKAPNGNPAPSGRDVITLEQTLPDGRTIRCRNPGWPPSGHFRVDQTVPLLRYHVEPESLLIDDPLFRREMYLGLICAGSFFTLAVCLAVALTVYAFRRQRHVVRLLETANVERFRIGKIKNKLKLIPYDNAAREPILMPNIGFYTDEVVNVFLDEEKPIKSFIAEFVSSPLVYDAATGTIDAVSDRHYRYGIMWAGIFSLGILLILSRILWVY